MNKEIKFFLLRVATAMFTGALVVPTALASNPINKNNKDQVRCQKSLGDHSWHKAFDSMSENDKATLNQVRTQYFIDTNDIWKKISDNTKELRIELSNELPDQDIVAKVNNQILTLKVDLNRITTDYETRVRKFFPDYVHGMGKVGSIINNSTNSVIHCKWRYSSNITNTFNNADLDKVQ